MTPYRLPRAFDYFDATADRVLRTAEGGGADHAAHLLSAAADRSRLWIGLGALRFARNHARDRRAAARAVIVVGVESAVVHAIVKQLFARPRPPIELALRYGARRPPSSSFPSGHAAAATSAAVLLAEGLGPMRLPLAGLAAAVCWARVQTGLHHSSDVIAGAAIGLGLGTAARRLFPLMPDQ